MSDGCRDMSGATIASATGWKGIHMEGTVCAKCGSLTASSSVRRLLSGAGCVVGGEGTSGGEAS